MVVAAPVVAAAPRAPSQMALVDRSAWDRAMRAYQRANRALDDHDAHYWATFDAFQCTKPTQGEIDFRAFPFADRNYVAHVLDLDQSWASWLSQEGKLWWAKDRNEAIARQLASYDSVRRYRQRMDEAERQSGYAAAEDLEERLQDQLSAATSSLITMPAPDVPALLWKMEYLLDGSAWSEEFLHQTLADARRLLSGGLN